MRTPGDATCREVQGEQQSTMLLFEKMLRKFWGQASLLTSLLFNVCLKKSQPTWTSICRKGSARTVEEVAVERLKTLTHTMAVEDSVDEAGKMAEVDIFARLLIEDVLEGLQELFLFLPRQMC